jgi:hypothetical protein
MILFYRKENGQDYSRAHDAQATTGSFWIVRYMINAVMAIGIPPTTPKIRSATMRIHMST